MILRPDFDVWVGRDFEASPSRLLLLGRSWWGADEALLTFIPRWISGTEPDQSFSCLFHACTGVPSAAASAAQRDAFWSSFAFYNFVQGSVGATAKAKPSRDDLERSASAFQGLMSFLKPRAVLILGKSHAPHAAEVLSAADIPYLVTRAPGPGTSLGSLGASWHSARALASRPRTV
jgi:hypothetical protein